MNEEPSRTFPTGCDLRGAVIVKYRAGACLQLELAYPDRSTANLWLFCLHAIRDHNAVGRHLEGGVIYDRSAWLDQVIAQEPHADMQKYLKHYVFLGSGGARLLEAIAELDAITVQRDDAWRRVSTYLESACREEGVSEWPLALASRPPGYLRAAAIWWTDAEVCNGGLDQYFVNSTNEIVWHAIAGYERIGRSTMANILRSAVFVCRETNPELLRASVPPGAFEQFEPLACDLDALDKLYYEELSRLPVANGVPNDGYLNGTVEYYWSTCPEDFHERRHAEA